VSGPRTNHAPEHGQPTGADHDAILEQVEAHALGALDRVDAGIVDQHLRWCTQCREQAESTRRVVELLALAVPLGVAPNPHVKRALLARVAADERAAPYEPALTRRDDEVLVRQAPAPTVLVRSTHDGMAGAQSNVRSWARFVPPAIIAPLAVALLVVGAWANSMRLDLAERERGSTLATEAGLNRIVANGGAVQLYSMEPQCDDCPGHGRLGVDSKDNMGVVVAWGLDPDQEHEVWCVDTKGVKAMVSTLDVGADGGAMQAFAFPTQDVAAYTEVYVAQKDGGAMYMVDLAPESGPPPTATPQR